MMNAPFRGLIAKIEYYRDEMVRLAAETSLSHDKVIETSTKLDRLLNEYSQCKK